MLRECVLFSILAVATVSGSGRFLVAHSPPSITFYGQEDIEESRIPQICASCLGFTVHEGSDWQGMYVKDPFNYAEAVVVLNVEGLETLGSIPGVISFPMNSDEDEETVYNNIKQQIVARYPTQNSTIVRLDLSSKHFFGVDQALDSDLSEEIQFTEELVEINRFIDEVENGGIETDGIPDLYWLTFRSLHLLADIKGLDDTFTKDAIEKVKDAFKRLSDAVSRAYNGEVLVASIISDATHTRKIRNKRAVDTKDMNLRSEFDPNYSAIFNIILWFMVAFVFSLIAISIVIGTMDPGRDSIIYRMTSNRMKKDN